MEPMVVVVVGRLGSAASAVMPRIIGRSVMMSHPSAAAAAAASSSGEIHQVAFLNHHLGRRHLIVVKLSKKN